ncbi:MAG: Peptidase M23 [Parcubacteria group bacterium GW2011_GWA2_47_26]|nr:MAG: Peptidase M23 [Parcubacteria group bacterium GW2011_GWA2_47_26]
MKESLFRLVLRSSLKLLYVFILAGRGLGFLGYILGCLIRSGAHLVIPVLLIGYLNGRKVKSALLNFIAPVRTRTFYIMGHRYFVHALVIFIVLLTASQSLLAANTAQENFGERSLLKELVGEEEENIVDDTLPAEELQNYLEGLFQNQPPARGEAGLPLALDGAALLNQELPGTLTAITRTEIVEYEVQNGDTIWGIAERFGVSVTTVLWENKLSLYSVIRPGQKLTILPVSGVSYAVRKGDTLDSIAKRYNGSAEEIKQYNKIAGEGELAVGLKITVPGGRPYSPPASQLQPQRREVVVAPKPATNIGGKGFIWPTVSRRITQYFKWRHAGIDIGGKNGVDPIYASEAGIVEYAGWGRGGWGNTVVIDHGNGTKTRYSHASKIFVAVGTQVSKGQTIALIGSTGRSTGPHVDFRIYINGRSVNPLGYIR